MPLQNWTWPQLEQYLRSKGASDEDVYEYKKRFWEENAPREYAGAPPEVIEDRKWKFLGQGTSILDDIGTRLERGGKRAYAGLVRTGGSFAGLVDDETKERLHAKAAEIAGDIPEVKGKPSFWGDVAESVIAAPGEASAPIAGGILGVPLGPKGVLLGAALARGLEVGGETEDVREAVKAGAIEGATTAPFLAARPLAAAFTKGVAPALRTAAFKATESAMSAAGAAGVAGLFQTPGEDIAKHAAAVGLISALTGGRHPLSKLQRKYAEQVPPPRAAPLDPLELMRLSDQFGMPELHYIATHVSPESQVRVQPMPGILGKAEQFGNKIWLADDLPTQKPATTTGSPQPIATLAHEMGHNDRIGVWRKKFEEEVVRAKEAGKKQAVTRNKFLDAVEREELRKLTQKLKPFDEATAPQEYVKYRYSDPELGAAAYTGFMLDPQAMRAEAPRTFAKIISAIDSNPEWSAAYQDAQAAMRAGVQETAQRFLAREQAGYRKASDEMMSKAHERYAAESSGLTKRVLYLLGDITGPHHAARKELLAGGKITKGQAEVLRHSVEQEVHFSDAAMRLFADFTESVMKPLEKIGVKGPDFSQWQRLQHVINAEGGKKFATGAVQGDDAIRALAELESRWTPEQRQAVAQAAARHHQNRVVNVIEPAYKNNVIDETMYNMMMANEFYVPQKPIKFAEQLFGKVAATGAMKKRTGSTQDIVNPGVAGTLTDLQIMKLTARTQHAKAVEEMLTMLSQGLDDPLVKRIRRYRDKKTGEWHQEKVPDGMDTVSFFENGKDVTIAVPKDHAMAFKVNSSETALAGRAASVLLKLPRAVFVKYNLPFAAAQTVRDPFQVSRTIYTNLPPIISHIVSFGEYWAKAIPEAHRFVAKGVASPDVKAMQLGKALPSTAATQFPVTAEDFTTQVPTKILEFSEGRPAPNMGKKLAAFFGQAMQYATQVTEIAPKIQGYKAAKRIGAKKGFTGEELEAYALNAARSLAGTPNTARTGHPLVHSTLNALSPFATAKLQGFEANTRIFREGTMLEKVNAASKLMIDFAVPKIAMALAARGVLKNFFDRVPDYAKESSFVVPLGFDQAGRAVWFNLTPDFMSQNLGAMFWQLYNDPKNLADVVKNLEGEVPYLTVNPVFSVALNAYKLSKGELPNDDFTGQPVVNETVFKTGDKKLIQDEFAQYAMRKLGGSLLYSFTSDSMEGVKAEVLQAFAPIKGAKEFIEGALKFSESDTPILSSVASRFIRASDRGLQEKYQREIGIPERQRQAKKTAYTQHFIDLYVKHERDGATPQGAYKAWVATRAKLGEDTPKWKDFWAKYKKAWTMRFGTREERLMAQPRSKKQRNEVAKWLGSL